ncbi:hypothetical protein PENSPDRAFT_335494 [Peniophora sp. CONT]|nr:hypothetical protein PENSPDRAFT_335494 [Peniophora sp. CONT]
MLRHAAASLEHLLYSRDDQNPSCGPQFTTNGRNPCDVGQTLLELCPGGEQILSLVNGTKANLDTVCNCNTVIYNLASACAICGVKNETDSDAVNQLPTFSYWTKNCTSTIWYTSFNGSSSLSGVPDWAFANITSEDRFDLSAVLGGDDSWSAVQILVPVIVGLALLIAFAAFWLWRFRRRKRMREIPVPTGIAPASWWCCARPRRVRHRRHVKGEWSVDADEEPAAFALENAPPSRGSASPAPTDRSRRRVRRLPRRVGTLVQHVQELLGRPVAVLERKGSGRGDYDIAADEDELRAARDMALAMDKPLPQCPEPPAPRSNYTGGVSMGVLGFLSRLGLSNASSSSGGGGSYTGVDVEDEDDDRVEVHIQVASEEGGRRHGGGRDHAAAGASRLGPASSGTSYGAESDNRATTGHDGQRPPSPSLFSRVATAATTRIAGPSRNRSRRSLADQGAQLGLNEGVPPVPSLPHEDELDEHRTIEEAMSIGDHSPATSYDPAPLPWAVRVNTSVPMLDGLGTGESGFLVPMESPASGVAREDNGSVVLISSTGRDFSLGPSSEGHSGGRSVRTNTTNTGTSGSNSRDRQSLAVYPPTPSDEARRSSNFGSPLARESIPPAMLLPPALGGPPSAWVRGPNGRLIPRRTRPRTISGNSSTNASRSHSDDESTSTGPPPVPLLPSINASQSRSATTSSSLRVEPQTPQTATESSGSHSHIHASGSSVVGGLPTPGQSPNASPRGLDGRSERSDTENLPFISPLPSTITALFDSLPNDGGPQSWPQPPSQTLSRPLFSDDEAFTSPQPLSGRSTLPPISEAPISPSSDLPPTAATSFFTNTSHLPAPPNTSVIAPSISSPVAYGTSTTVSKSRSSGTSSGALTNGSLLLAPPNTAAVQPPEAGRSGVAPGRSTQTNAPLEPDWRTDVGVYDPPSTKSHQASLHRDPSPSSFSLQAPAPAQKPYNNESKTSLPQSPPLSKHPSHSPSSSLSSLHSLERPSGPRSHTHPGSVPSKTHGRAASASQTSLPRPPDSPPLHGRSVSTSYLSPSPPAPYLSPPMPTHSPYPPSQRSAAASSTSLYSPQAPSLGLAYSPAQSSISLSSRPLPVPGPPPGASPARISGEGLGARPLPPPGPPLSRGPSGSRGAQAGYGQFGQRVSTVAEEEP